MGADKIVFFFLQVIEYCLGVVVLFPELIGYAESRKDKAGLWGPVLATGLLYGYNGMASVVSLWMVILLPAILAALLLGLRQNYAWERVTWAFVYLGTVSLVKLVALNMIGIAQKRTMMEVNFHPPVGVFVAVELILSIVLAWILWRVLKTDSKLYRYLRGRKFFLVFCGTVELVLEHYIMYIGQNGISTELLMLNLCGVVTIVLTFFAFMANSTKQRITAAETLLEMKNHMLAEQLRQMKQDYGEIAKLNHEIKRERQFLLACLSEGKVEEAMEMLREKENCRHEKRKVWTGNRFVDFLLNTRIQEIEDRKIKTEFFFDIIRIPLKDEDLYIVLGNLLDNAVEAAGGCEPGNRWLSLRLQNRNQLFQIEIANSSSKKPVVKDGKFYSSKKGGGHGWGLENVKILVEQNHGIIDFCYDEQEFRVNILF